MLEDIVKVKAIKAFLNTRYSSVLGWSLDANNFLVDQDTFKFLRQALRYEVGMSLDTPDSNPTFKNKLDNVGEKLNNGWTSNVINLLKITLVLKNIAPNLDYESSVYGESFGLALYQFQTDAGILDVVGDQSFKSYEIIALFSDYGFKPVLATDAKARELGQYLNSYVIKQGIASIVGLTRTDGLVYNFGDYSPLIVAQLQRENQLNVTGKLTVCPAYNDGLNSTTYPTAEALYLREYLDNISQDYFDIVDYRAAIENYQTKCGYPKNNTQLTAGEMQTLFNSSPLGTINGLKLKQVSQDLLSQMFNNSTLQVEWNQSIDLGNIGINMGLMVLNVHASVEVDFDTKIKNSDGFNSDHTSYTTTITNGKFSSASMSNKLDNATAKVLLKPLQGPVLQSKITSGKMSMTIEDSNWTGDFTLTYALEIDGIKNKSCSNSVTVKVKINLTYDKFIQAMANDANSSASEIYNSILQGQYPENLDPKYGVDPDNEGLNLYAFSQVQTMRFTHTQFHIPVKVLTLFNHPLPSIDPIEFNGSTDTINASIAYTYNRLLTGLSTI